MDVLPQIPDVARAAARHSDADARFHDLWKVKNQTS